MPAHTQVPATLMLPLAEYGLKPGDTVQLFARASDTDPAGAKSADSTLVTLHIVSQEAMDRMMVTKAGMETLQSKYAAAERRLEAADAQLQKIEKELAKADPNSKPSPELQKKLDDAAKQMEKAAAEINKLSQHPLPFDIDHALNQQLKDLAKTVGDASDEAKKTATDPSLSAAGALDKVKKIRKDLGVKKDEYDQDATAPLEYLSKVFPLIEDQAKFLDLYAREKDLDGRMKTIKDLNNPDDPQVKAQMRNFEDEQRAIRGDLAKLLDDIDNHVAQLPDDEKLDDLRKSAKDFADAVRASPANYEMQTSESALENFNGVTGESFANAASQTLSTFIARCQSIGDQGKACLNFQPKLSAGLGNTVDQMLKSMGLSMGPGTGGVGGYSATRNSLANVGLYGAIPTHGEESNGSGGDADHGAADNSHGLRDDSTNPEGGANNGHQHASGQSDAPVPAQYKKRVGEYFQRVSDELSQ
jgi:myosin heavy subunit